MFARVVRLRFQLAKIAEAETVIRDSVFPVVKEQRGFKDQYLLLDRATGKAVSLNFWATEKDSLEFDQSPLYRGLLGKIASFVAEPPVAERYEVAAT